MPTKLEKLLRYHRQNVFHDDAATADRHERALRRIKRTKAFRDMCAGNEDRRAQVLSDRLLRTYA